MAGELKILNEALIAENKKFTINCVGETDISQFNKKPKNKIGFCSIDDIFGKENPKLGNEIKKMVDNSKDITYEQFIKEVNMEDIKKVTSVLGYDDPSELENDYAVGFGKSKFKNKPCVFFTHSHIEYIFT